MIPQAIYDAALAWVNKIRARNGEQALTRLPGGRAGRCISGPIAHALLSVGAAYVDANAGDYVIVRLVRPHQRARYEIPIEIVEKGRLPKRVLQFIAAFDSLADPWDLGHDINPARLLHEKESPDSH